jgi:malate dehydrogenase (oxaloacetate-decarboxylating)
MVKRYCLSLLKKTDPLEIRKGTIAKNYCAIITDGTAILGYGDIGSLAGLPVMEGKIALFKELGNVNVIPFSLESGLTLNQMKLVIKSFADSFSAINLEDIGAPLCFDLEMDLNKELPIPIFHDDQHGTAIVVLAGLINSLKIVEKDKSECSVIINGAGAAGMAICKLMMFYGFSDITLVDSKGAIYEGREDLVKNKYKLEMSKKTNKSKKKGKLGDIIINKDIFIGVSKGNVLSTEMVKTMNPKAIVFALANPTPEILPDKAKEGGAYVVATGRSDFPNQVNNSLVFPGIFRGLIDSNRRDVDLELKAKAAIALASVITDPEPGFIIPASLNSDISKIIAQNVHSATLKPKL